LCRRRLFFRILAKKRFRLAEWGGPILPHFLVITVHQIKNTYTKSDGETRKDPKSYDELTKKGDFHVEV
jgi:hypothetical protein